MRVNLPLIFESVFGESELVSIRAVEPGVGPWTVTFSVKDQLTNKPIEGTTIQANGTMLTTDANGMATTTIQGGSRIIIVSKSGYWTKSSVKTISKDQTIEVKLIPIWALALGGGVVAVIILGAFWYLRAREKMT